MARKVTKKDNRNLAKLVTVNRAPCAFCHREVDDEVTFGKLYAIGDIQCHYFCALLSCCLVQKGPEEEGLFGFMYRDILAELDRSKKHKCSYCSHNGANLGCSVGSCRKQFHLPCGREKNAVSLFYGSYKSFCQLHAPKQKIPDHIMCKAKLRMKDERKNIAKQNDDNSTEEMVCVICYESVKAHPGVDTFWPPCCARDAWFHRSCLQRMALSAGMHYLKCPLCNDKEHFYEAVVSQGYYVPDRDAAWELEQNAFAEIYERPLNCSADNCLCPMGRNHDADQGMWDIKLCLLCGSVGCHAHCMGASETARYICLTCTPAAPEDIQQLAETIEKLIVQEQASTATNNGPVMPSRMSLRRTKGRLAYMNRPSASKVQDNVKNEVEPPVQNTKTSRQELNLKSPRKLILNKSPEKSPKKIKSLTPSKSDSYRSSIRFLESYKNVDTKLLSPMKLLEQGFKEKVCMGSTVMLDEKIVDLLRKRFKKPQPLSVKKRIVDEILDGLFKNSSNNKQKEPVREWCSPRKSDVTEEQKNADENQPKASEITVENSINDTPISHILHSTPNKNKINMEVDKISEEKARNIDDDDSNSTFQLPSEFIAELSDENSFSPKRKTIEMTDSSLEISEKDHSVNIDVIKINNLKKCSFKFSRLDTEKLEDDNVGIDIESFKKGYLSEVERDSADKNVTNSQTVLHFSKDSRPDNDKCRKRKMSEGNTIKNQNEYKRRKISENDLNLSVSGDDFDIKNENLKKSTDIDRRKKADRKRQSVQQRRKMSRRVNIKQSIENKVTDLQDTSSKHKEERIKSIKNIPKSRAKKNLAIESENRGETEELRQKSPKDIKSNVKDIIKDKCKEKRKKVKRSKDKTRNSKCATHKKHKHSERSNDRKRKNKNIKVTIGSEKKNLNTKLSISNNEKDISLKIKWKKKQLRLKIESKNKKTVKIDKDNSKLKQYVLQYFSEVTPQEVLVKPEKEVTPLKRKYIKQEKTPDNLKQMSIQNFFKVKSPKD